MPVGGRASFCLAILQLKNYQLLFTAQNIALVGRSWLRKREASKIDEEIRKWLSAFFTLQMNNLRSTFRIEHWAVRFRKVTWQILSFLLCWPNHVAHFKEHVRSFVLIEEFLPKMEAQNLSEQTVETHFQAASNSKDQLARKRSKTSINGVNDLSSEWGC